MKKLKIKDLKKFDLNLGDYGENIIDYSSNQYISDIFSEIADNNVNIYNYDLLQWVANDLYNIEYCNEAINEFGANDFIAILQQAQYLEISENLNNHIEDILLYYAYTYIENNLDIEEITEEQDEKIKMLNFRKFDKLYELEAEIEEIFESEE